jgi:hypothetical protein
MLGAAAHGVVMWLVFVAEIGWAGILFPIAALSLSLWFILAGAWPVRGAAPYETPDLEVGAAETRSSAVSAGAASK